MTTEKIFKSLHWWKHREEGLPVTPMSRISAEKECVALKEEPVTQHFRQCCTLPVVRRLLTGFFQSHTLLKRNQLQGDTANPLHFVLPIKRGNLLSRKSLPYKCIRDYKPHRDLMSIAFDLYSTLLYSA